jgi:hypothetical protein
MNVDEGHDFNAPQNTLTQRPLSRKSVSAPVQPQVALQPVVQAQAAVSPNTLRQQFTPAEVGVPSQVTQRSLKLV